VLGSPEVNGRYYDTGLTYRNKPVYIKENKRCVLYFDKNTWNLSFNQHIDFDFYKSTGTSITGTWIKNKYGKDDVPSIKSINQQSNYSFSDKPNDGKTYKYKVFNYNNFLSGINGYYSEFNDDPNSYEFLHYEHHEELYYFHDNGYMWDIWKIIDPADPEYQEGMGSMRWHVSVSDWEEPLDLNPGKKGAYYDISLAYPFQYGEDKNLEEYDEVPPLNVTIKKNYIEASLHNRLGIIHSNIVLSCEYCGKTCCTLHEEYTKCSVPECKKFICKDCYGTYNDQNCCFKCGSFESPHTCVKEPIKFTLILTSLQLSNGHTLSLNYSYEWHDSSIDSNFNRRWCWYEPYSSETDELEINYIIEKENDTWYFELHIWSIDLDGSGELLDELYQTRFELGKGKTPFGLSGSKNGVQVNDIEKNEYMLSEDDVLGSYGE
jgi:hypothetical protein